MRSRFFAFVLSLIMMFSVIPATSLSVSAATSGRTEHSTYCTVRISQKLINKRGTQYAKVKIKTYDMTGWWNTGAKVRITLRDGNGRYICSWIGKGGDTLKLGDDHSTYRIYVDYYESDKKGVIASGNNFINIGSAYKWKFSNPQNCTIS